MTATVAPRLLVVHRDVVRLRQEGSEAVFWHAAEGRQIPLGRALAAVVQQFAMPCTVEAAAAALGAGADPAVVAAATERLLAMRVLMPYERTAAAEPRPVAGLFLSPVLPLADTLRGDVADAVVIGMPYDVGVTYRPGTRFAPDYLRRVSSSLFQYTEVDGVPQGMYDPVRGRRVLAGVRLVDAGNLSATVFTRNGEAFDALQRVVHGVAAAGRMPVVLGGDHSVSLPVVRGLLDAHGRIGVLHVDAHTDFREPRTDGWRTDCHHGNVMNWVVGDERVDRVVQFGIRQLNAETPQLPAKLRQWPGTSAAVDPGRVLADLPDNIPYHLTIDVDGLDPSAMPATGTPLPGGFSHSQLVTLLELVCRRRRVVGVDLVEVLPPDDDVCGLVASDLLLRVLDAAVSRDRR